MKKLLSIIASAVLLFSAASCSFLDTAESNETQTETEYGRIAFDTGDNVLTDIVLKGTDASGTEKTFGSWTDNADLKNAASVKVPVGNWNFTLTLKKDGVLYSGTASAVINKGETANVVFEMNNIEKADYKISIPFSDVPVIGESAKAKIYKDDVLVDEISASNEKLYAINGPKGAIGEIKAADQLLIVDGNSIIVVPHNDEKGYSKLTSSSTYKVVLEGITGTPVSADYTFTTKKAQLISDNTINVGSAESDNFYTIQGALNYLRLLDATGDWTINVAAGKYHENLFYYGAANVTIAGPADFDWGNADSSAAYVYWRNSQNIGNGQRSRQSFIWQGTGNLVLKNMYFENTTNRAVEGNTNVQAETLYFDSDADLIVYNSKFMSYQDTLLIGTSNSTIGYGGRAWFYDCQIGGDVDFIWGYASVALFEKCNIICRADGVKNSAEIFASRTVPSKEVLGKGFVLLNSTIDIEDGCDAYYGRSSGGGDSQALVINTTVNGTINPKLWNSAGDITIQDGTGDYICAFMSYNNKDKDGNVISTAGKIEKTYDMSQRIAEREYNGRYAILNREIVSKTAVYQNRASKTAWDISSYEKEFGAEGDASKNNLYVEPTYTKNVVGGNTVQLTTNKTGSTFESEDTEVATVDSNGLVTTVTGKDKTVKITVTDPNGGRNDYAYINVVPTYVKAGKITIDETETELPIYQIATITASFDVEPNDTDIVWTVSNDSVIKFVDESKKTLVSTITTTDKKVQFVSLKSGNATITASSGVTPEETTAGSKEFTVNTTRYYNAVEATVIQDKNVFGILNFQSGKVGIWHDIYVHAIYEATRGKIAASGNRIQSRYGTLYIPVTESCVIDMTVQCTAEEDESKWYTKDMTDAEGVAPQYSKDTETVFASDAERQSYAYHYKWEYDAENDAGKKVSGTDVKALFDASTKDNNRTLVGATPDENATYFAIKIPGADRYITSITIKPDSSIHHEPVAATLTIEKFADSKKTLDLNGEKTVTVTTSAASSDGATPVVSYKSSNEKIATVDAETGAVTAVGIGEVTITATAKHPSLESVVEKSVTYTVHVSDSGSPAESYTIDLANTTGSAGDYGIFATVSKSGGSAGRHNEHGWRMASGDTMSVKVAGASVIKLGKCQYGCSLPTADNATATATTTGANASKCGSETMDFVYKETDAATVTFTFSGEAYIHSVSVEPYEAPTNTITASFKNEEVVIDLKDSTTGGQTVEASATEGTLSVKYSSSDVSVATVDSDTGIVTAVGLGKTTITATITCEKADPVVKTYIIKVVNTEAVVSTYTFTLDGSETIASKEDDSVTLTSSGISSHGSYGATTKDGTLTFDVKGNCVINVYPNYPVSGITVGLYDGETKLDEYTADCTANSANSIEGVAPFPVIYNGEEAKTLTVKISASSSIYLRTVQLNYLSKYTFTLDGSETIASKEDDSVTLTSSGISSHGSYGATTKDGTLTFDVKGNCVINVYPNYPVSGITVGLYDGETKLDEYTADCIANSANSIEGVAPFPVKYHGGAKTLTVKISASGSIYLRTVIGEF